MFVYMRQVDKDLYAVRWGKGSLLHQGQLHQGQSMNSFKAGTVGRFWPKKTYLTSSRMDGMLYDKKSTTYADVNNLVSIAIRNYRRMDS